MPYSTIFGIDSHARTTTICALVAGTGETRTRTFRGNDYGAMRGWMSGFPAPARGVYEAGCTGFVPARLLASDDVEVAPIAPSKRRGEVYTPVYAHTQEHVQRKRPHLPPEIFTRYATTIGVPCLGYIQTGGRLHEHRRLLCGS